MEIKSIIPENTCCDMRDSWNIISKLSNDFWVIVHWPTWCENEFFYSDKFSHSHSFSTNLNEYDVTMWTWYNKLLSKIKYVLANFSDIKVLFVLWTCSSELIWDDIDNIKDELDTDIEIIIIHTSWMRGACYHYTKYNIFKSLFAIFNKEEWKHNQEKNINIFFQDWMQNDSFREEIKDFLSIFWIKVNSFLNSNITLEELKTINNVSYNYLIWRDSEFILLLDYIKDKFNVDYKVLDLPIWFKNLNKFYYSIYSSFFTDKKLYVIEFIKSQKKVINQINKELLSNYFNKLSFKVNFKLYWELLNDIWLKFNNINEVNYEKSINSSHKFNFSNKIIITKKGNDFKWNDLFWSKSFNTINKYMWFIWLDNFYIDIKNQSYYNNFLDRYNKYF